jgi:hypothetical protein
MNVDLALLGPVSAILAAFMIGSASLTAAIYTHRGQDRLQRVAAEINKREAVYADFVMHASNLLLVARTRDELELTGEEQHLVGLITRMRLFAPAVVTATAEAVVRTLVQISLEPSVELRQLAIEALDRGLEPDPLLTFSLVCRADLDSLRAPRAQARSLRTARPDPPSHSRLPPSTMAEGVCHAR